MKMTPNTITIPLKQTLQSDTFAPQKHSPRNAKSAGRNALNVFHPPPNHQSNKSESDSESEKAISHYCSGSNIVVFCLTLPFPFTLPIYDCHRLTTHTPHFLFRSNWKEQLSKQEQEQKVCPSRPSSSDTTILPPAGKLYSCQLTCDYKFT